MNRYAFDNLALVTVPRMVGDVDEDLLDTPCNAPVAPKPLRLVVGADRPCEMPALVFDEPPEPLPDDRAERDVVDTSRTPTTPLNVTPSLMRRRG